MQVGRGVGRASGRAQGCTRLTSLVLGGSAVPRGVRSHSTVWVEGSGFHAPLSVTRGRQDGLYAVYLYPNQFQVGAGLCLIESAVLHAPGRGANPVLLGAQPLVLVAKRLMAADAGPARAGAASSRGPRPAFTDSARAPG